MLWNFYCSDIQLICWGVPGISMSRRPIWRNQLLYNISLNRLKRMRRPLCLWKGIFDTLAFDDLTININQMPRVIDVKFGTILYWSRAKSVKLQLIKTMGLTAAVGKYASFFVILHIGGKGQIFRLIGISCKNDNQIGRKSPNRQSF